jgi:hypothetical protein
VENSSNKSFIACIADVYATKFRLPEVPSIKTMCGTIASAVNIDLFLKYHNGSLAAIFRPKLIDLDSIDHNIYQTSEFMKKLDSSNETHLDFINETIAAYENFIAFLKDENSYIDHTYLWDIICSENPFLFSKGCNLAILRIRNVDMTDDIELLCPTSVYSPVLFDVRKETIILIQHDEFFEPVYLFHSKIQPSSFTIEKTFSESKSPIKHVLQIIRNSIQKYCPPKSSMPQTYTFARGNTADATRILLLEHKFVIRAQVLNYQGKTVAFWVKYENGGIYIPCFPSSPLPEYPILFMDDPNLWLDYDTTVHLLNRVYERSKGNILSRPVFKIIEDEYIIGVLTETNQFVMLSDPIEVGAVEDDIPVLKDENFLMADKKMAQAKSEDRLRTQTIRKIRLETQFYGAFRTTIRILLNDPVNSNYKQQIVKLVENKGSTNKTRELIETLLHRLCDPFIAFKEYDEDVINTFEEISDCFLNPEEKKYCVIQNGRYQMILPKYHLVSGRSNALLYFARMADELWRYKRIQLFMLNAKMYLNLTNTEYKINDNEMLLLESLLTSEYLKSLEPYQHGNTLITYETANPIITQKYGNEISHKTQIEMVSKDTSKKDLESQLPIECVQKTYKITGKPQTSEWKQFFSKKSEEMELYQTVYCSYYPIIYVYHAMNDIFLTIQQIKSDLIIEYREYGDQYDKILDILRKQGKKDMIDKIYKHELGLEETISMDGYFLTSLDLWILANKYQLPIILFHSINLKHLVDSVKWLQLSNVEQKEYYFIRVPTEPNTPGIYLPKYTIVKPTVDQNDPALIELFTKASSESTMSLLDYFLQMKLPNRKA